jgi:arsenate reductase
VVEYLKHPLSEKTLERLLVKLNMKPAGLVRTQEEYYKKYLRNKQFHDHEWIRILTENPRLIRRPIVEKEYKAVIGDPVENIDSILT